MRYLLPLLLAVACAAQAQQLYRWTDKDGKTHYGQNPPPGVTAKPVKDTTSQVAPQAPAAGTSQSATEGGSGGGGGGREPESKPRIDRSKQY